MEQVPNPFSYHDKLTSALVRCHTDAIDKTPLPVIKDMRIRALVNMLTERLMTMNKTCVILEAALVAKEVELQNVKPDLVEQPIPMVLHCPKCGAQHIDEAEEERTGQVHVGPMVGTSEVIIGWDNPPHRSHLCHECGTIWRPADVPTMGVVSIETKGKADTWNGTQAPQVDVEPVPEVLFDGFAVLQSLSDSAKKRTSAQNVSDVLDAVVRCIRATQQAQTKGGAE